MSALEEKKRQTSFGGQQGMYAHDSKECGVRMDVNVYVPPELPEGGAPVVYFLSGLTCTPENFTTKAGAQSVAAREGLILVMPDTSPRGDDVPDEEGWDFGKGAGFYVDATQSPWSSHYRMASYVSKELPALIDAQFPTNGKRSLMGHSMGGHGALTLGLREPDAWASLSAFSPICAPSQCAWGEKAFGKYLGADRTQWAAHDATELLGQGIHSAPIRIDQGLEDGFYKDGQLLPQKFEAAAKAAGQKLELGMHAGYDHSYYFIASFVEAHLMHHRLILR